MLKLIIADDERVIRETISRLIDWESLGIVLTGLCSNGLEAYDMIIDESPDIVMTDIKMPGMGGLDLIKKINEANPDTRFIILSGYGEFEYAKEAMKYGVKHYILKPCNEKQITESILEASKDCYALKRRQTILPGPEEFPAASNRFVQKIYDYVEQHLADSDITLKKIAETHLFMNVDYVSKRFLKETGRKFSDYLAEVRIRKARQYLAEGRKIQEVAEKVGCGNNPHYFSQLFKKKTGMTPSAYVSSLEQPYTTS